MKSSRSPGRDRVAGHDIRLSLCPLVFVGRIAVLLHVHTDAEKSL